ncbi:glycosyltransferase family 39 protein [Streptomyces sp. NPDC097619]|uniref:ArnT family glycosyltransferase n=1 Tax=Streptomyces sp. NPDC097619 TaxID=3157228 RepID=UPI00332BFF3F
MTTAVPVTAPAVPPPLADPARPGRQRAALAALLIGTALLYLWNLSASGYANSFYSAAAQAGSESWKAFFFGSSDAGNSITVDKPPAALWPMALSVRLFGLGSWQILVPQVLMGVGTTAVLFAAVRRQFGAAAGLLAGAVFALTPVAALMFRFNNPDALLTLLLTVAVYCVLRALEAGRTGWLVAAGAAVGLAFLTKTLQAFLVLPPLTLVYAVCAPVRLRRRLGQLLLSGLAMVVAGGWWVAVVELWPDASRPYIGGSQNNSFLELTLGYNGLGRINGEEIGSVGGGARPTTGDAAGAAEAFRPGGGGGGGWGETGIDRLFSGNIGGQIAWLLPAALILLVAGLVVTRRAGRATGALDSVARAAFLAWGGCLLVTLAVFSFMQGIFHEYYTVALAPYLAALVAMGAAVLWEERGTRAARAALAGTVAVTALWSYVLLGRAEGYLPWLRWAVLVVGLAAAAGLLVRRAALWAAGLGLAASLAGPLAYSLTTVSEGHTGSIVTAGPAVAGGGGPGGRGFRPPGGGQGGFPGGFPGRNAPGAGNPGTGTGQGTGNGNDQGLPAMPPDGFTGGPGTFPGGGTPDGTGAGTGNRGRGDGRGGQGTGGPGGLLGGTTVGTAVRTALSADADRYTWVAATTGAQNAAGYQLATGRAVMPIGGFNGSDPSPTLERFKEYVAQGRIHYYIGGASEGGGMRGGGGPGGSVSTVISTWVTENFTARTVDGTTLYDLTDPKS